MAGQEPVLVTLARGFGRRGGDGGGGGVQYVYYNVQIASVAIALWQ